MFIALFEVRKQDPNELALIVVEVISHRLAPNCVRGRPVRRHVEDWAGSAARLPSPAVIGQALGVKSGGGLIES
eukprot:6590991-Pyramimonas_sp.AAC.1